MCSDISSRKGGLTRNDLSDSTKSEHVNCKIITAFCIKICMIQFLKDRMSSISSDLKEDVLKLNKSHTNRTIQIAPCKTSLTKTASK